MSQMKVFFIIILMLVLIVSFNNLFNRSNVVHAEETKIIRKGLTLVYGKLNGIEIRNYYFKNYNLTQETFDHLCKISHIHGLIGKSHIYIYKENAKKILNLNIYNVLTHGVPEMNRARHDKIFNLVSYQDYLERVKRQYLGNSIEMENKYMIPQNIEYQVEIEKYMDKRYEKINKIFDNQEKSIHLFDYILGNSYDNLQYKKPDYYCKNEKDFLKNFSSILTESLKDKQAKERKELFSKNKFFSQSKFKQ